jgi:ribosomal protein L20A (L18A)
MSEWIVRGSFLARRSYWQGFTKSCAAADEKAARETVLSLIGSCHGVKRGNIRIDEVRSG